MLVRVWHSFVYTIRSCVRRLPRVVQRRRRRWLQEQRRSHALDTRLGRPAASSAHVRGPDGMAEPEEGGRRCRENQVQIPCEWIQNARASYTYDVIIHIRYMYICICIKLYIVDIGTHGIRRDMRIDITTM